jgi:low temperature requirement protein LtrA
MKDLLYFSKHRHATWLELFFDLVFVVLMGKVTHVLAHTHHGHLDFHTIVKFVFMFIPVWWIWANHTIFNNRYDDESKHSRLVTLFIMLLVILLSVFTNTNFKTSFLGFAIIYSAIRSLMIYLHFRMMKLYRKESNYLRTMGLSYSVGMLLGLSSILFHSEFRYIIMMGSIFLDVLAPVFWENKYKHREIHREHLVERNGLLTLILMGETIISLSYSFSNIEWNTYNIIATISGFVLLGSLWWIYFDSFHLLEHNKKLTKSYQIIIPHIFTFMGLVILANVIRHAILNDLYIRDFRILAMASMVIFFFGKQYLYYKSLDIKWEIVINYFQNHWRIL